MRRIELQAGHATDRSPKGINVGSRGCNPRHAEPSIRFDPEGVAPWRLANDDFARTLVQPLSGVEIDRRAGSRGLRPRLFTFLPCGQKNSRFSHGDRRIHVSPRQGKNSRFTLPREEPSGSWRRDDPSWRRKNAAALASEFRQAPRPWRIRHGAVRNRSFVMNGASAPVIVKKTRSATPGWRNWQTRMVEGHVPARVWRFESSSGHDRAGDPGRISG